MEVLLKEDHGGDLGALRGVPGGAESAGSAAISAADAARGGPGGGASHC